MVKAIRLLRHDNRIVVQLDGQAVLVDIGSGNPRSCNGLKSERVPVLDVKALPVSRTIENTGGTVRMTMALEGLSRGRTSLTTE